MTLKEKIASILNSRKAALENSIIPEAFTERNMSLMIKLELHTQELDVNFFAKSFEEDGIRGILMHLSKILNGHSLRLNSSSSSFENFRNQEKTTECAEILNMFLDFWKYH